MVKYELVHTNSYISKTKLPVADYAINPYIGCSHKCMYCYAEFMRRFTGHHDEEWGEFVDIKLCNKQINTKKLSGSSIFIGSVTDPYMPCEAKHKITQSILTQLIDCDASIDLQTKSALVARDIDILKQIPNIKVGFSICTLDDTFRKDMEPCAGRIEDRIKALEQLHAAGIRTYIFMSPMFPGITDFKAIIRRTSDIADEFWFENLNLRSGYRTRVLHYIEKNCPELVPLYDEIYRKRNMQYWEQLSKEIDDFCTGYGCTYHNYFYHEKIKKK